MQKKKKKTITAKPLTRNSNYKTDSHRTTSVNPSFVSPPLFPHLCSFLLVPVVVVFIAFHYCYYHLQSRGSYLYTVSSMQCGNRQIWLNSRPSTHGSCDTAYQVAGWATRGSPGLTADLMPPSDRVLGEILLFWCFMFYLCCSTGLSMRAGGSHLFSLHLFGIWYKTWHSMNALCLLSLELLICRWCFLFNWSVFSREVKLPCHEFWTLSRNNRRRRNCITLLCNWQEVCSQWHMPLRWFSIPGVVTFHNGSLFLEREGGITSIPGKLSKQNK